jgi:glycosyltransferase involved in cell wall biosynthesis
MIGGKAISAFVITYNEEDNIADCLESMKWADELVVVDSFSQDRTVEIARRYTERIIQHEFAGHVAQTRYASEQTTCPWVLWLDADERLTQEALDEVREVLSHQGEPEYSGFAFPRKTFFMGRWILHSGWYPQHKVRLWYREAGTVTGEEPHPRVDLYGPFRKLKGDILHYTYPEGVKDMAAASTRYAWYAARERHAAGRKFHPLHLLLKPPGVFLKKYLLQTGFLDGLPGFAISVGAAYHRFLRETMLWEMAHQSEPPPFKPPTMPESL